jgi:hypothetical protein
MMKFTDCKDIEPYIRKNNIVDKWQNGLDIPKNNHNNLDIFYDETMGNISSKLEKELSNLLVNYLYSPSFKIEKEKKQFLSFLSNNLSNEFNISFNGLEYDKDENKNVCIFNVGDIPSKGITDFHLKIREFAYYYAKDNDLMDFYDNVIFLLVR